MAPSSRTGTGEKVHSYQETLETSLPDVPVHGTSDDTDEKPVVQGRVRRSCVRRSGEHSLVSCVSLLSVYSGDKRQKTGRSVPGSTPGSTARRKIKGRLSLIVDMPCDVLLEVIQLHITV